MSWHLYDLYTCYGLSVGSDLLVLGLYNIWYNLCPLLAIETVDCVIG